MLRDNWVLELLAATPFTHDIKISDLNIKTEANIKTAVAKVKFDVDVDPWVYMLSIGYRF
jgi:outer membrane protein W